MPIFRLDRAFHRSLYVLLALGSTFISARAGFASGPPTILAMGDSITVGVDYLTGTAGGYRDPLYRDLTAAGISFTFVGLNSSEATPALTAAGEQQHSGFGGWHVGDLDANLDGVAAPVGGGDSNNGGYILTGGHGTGRGAVTPDMLLLHIGTNDLLQNTANLNQALYSLVTHIHALTPKTIVLIAGVIPINNTGLMARVNAYNAYIKTQLVPSLSYTVYVDQNSSFLNADGSANGALLGSDLVHPNRYGYPVLAQNWAAAVEALLGATPSGHQLTVAGGSGGGAYPAGSVITLQARQAAAYQQFASWTTASTLLNNPYATPVVYTMPAADTTVTANYAVQGSPILVNGTYEIASSFDGLAVTAAGAATANAVQQQTFTNLASQNWTLTNLGGNVVSLVLVGTNEALEVPASSVSSVGAALDVAPYVGSANQQWMLTPVAGVLEIVNQGSGQAVNIAGYSTVPGTPLLQFSLSYVDEWWVFYPGSATVTTYPLTVSQGTGGGTYAVGSAISISANPAPAGMQFAGWSGGTSGLASVSSASTTLTMPASADVLTATYAPSVATYALTVNGGRGGGSYAAGTVVQVAANAAASGSHFAAWAGGTAALASSLASTTTVTMPSSPVVITATYSTTAAALPVAPSTSSTVSVQFIGGGAAPLHGKGYDYTAGASGYAAGYWNPVLNIGNTTTPQNLSMLGTLVDSTGALSSVGFQLRSSGAYYTGANAGWTGSPAYPGYPGRTSGTGSAFLYSGFAYAGYSDFNALTLTLLGLNPAHAYTILLYVAPFQQFGAHQKATVMLLGGQAAYVMTDGAAAGYERVTSTTAGSPGTGNFVQFDQVSGASSQTVSLTNSGSMVGLSGFQVVDLGLATGTTPVPSSPVASSPVVSIPVVPVPVVPVPVAPLPVIPIPATPAPVAGSPISVVSLQFVGGGAAPLHGSSFDYTAGAYAVGHWNPLLFTGNTTSAQVLSVPSGLADSSGTPSAIGLQLSASGAYYTGSGGNFPGAPAYPGFPGQATGNGDSFLFSGFAYAGYSNQAPLTLTVTGLNPAHTYQLLVYITPFEGFGDKQTATVALTGGASLNVTSTGIASVYQRAGVAQGQAAGNYVEFEAVTGSASQTVTFTNTSSLVGVSGMQVVDLGPG